MQNNTEFNTDHPQIQSVAVKIPYRRVFRFLVIALAFQAATTCIAAVYFVQSSATQIFDVSTAVSIMLFIFGSLMWGRFPNVDTPLADSLDKRSLPNFGDSHEMSMSNRVRGGLLMVSSILFVLSSAGLYWMVG